jgi:hypothetical protein
MPDSQVRVVKRLFARNPFRRIKREHLGQQVDGKWVGMRIEGRKGNAGFDGKRSDVVLSLGEDRSAAG